MGTTPESSGVGPIEPADLTAHDHRYKGADVR
jgi:hypothetical protein